ncbi:MAG: gliding motility lipoprotein GldD [Bacteroidales bacterium]|nr:gliding motility lipoprotein GldD [Bacteroidales bacterium]MCL2133200.1 gliding motility lipoprotein GldD [Bacteroidales bacterium]
MKAYSIYILFFVLLSACNNSSTPRPNGYMRIDLPEKAYRLFDSTGYPYRFECPAYAQIIPDTESYNYEPFWINMKLPAKATLHLSYKKVNNNLTAMLDDTDNFVYRHVVKADAIIESTFQIKDRKVFGIIYEIGGNAASSVQFYATDSSRHFLRGALYFNETPNHEFLAPMIKYYTADIFHLLETLVWKQK